MGRVLWLLPTRLGEAKTRDKEPDVLCFRDINSDRCEEGYREPDTGGHDLYINFFPWVKMGGKFLGAVRRRWRGHARTH